MPRVTPIKTPGASKNGDASSPDAPREDTGLYDKLSRVREFSDASARAQGLLALAPHLPADERSALLPEILASARAIPDESARARVLGRLAPFLSGTGLSSAVLDELRAIANRPERRIEYSINRLSEAKPSDVQQIAASQLSLLTGYHEMALAQSRRSFSWALVGAAIGLVFFVVAVTLAVLKGYPTASIPLLSGAVVEVVAGVVFSLYGRTSSQVSLFHSRLEVLQRYLLANSMCESLEGDDRSKARTALIQEVSRTSNVQKS